eukprot:TRINITY_DN973_c4_g1_i1.p1 TRINITY_DN973_c4_g1~~TRINITY_DN973_c4_g1_i1.p1  ORF type:complete len:760 (+),score=218.40 TRINITY_DN973_c4_g1_i1:70-2280(+)
MEGLRAASGSVKMAVVTCDVEGIIRSANEYACALFGWEKSVFIGKNVNVLMPSPYKEQHNAYIKRYLQSHKPRVLGSSRKVEGITSAGEHLHLNLTLSEVEDQELGTLFVACFEAVTDMAIKIVADGNGTILDVEGKVFPVLGYDREELLGQNVSVLVVEPHRSKHNFYIDRYKKTRKGRAMNLRRNLQAQHKYRATPVNICLYLTEKHFPEKSGPEQDQFLAQITPVDELQVVVTMGPRGEILSASDDFVTLFGYDGAELDGKSIAMLLKSTDDVAELIAHYPGGVVKHNFTALHKDGSFFVVSFVFEQFEPEGEQFSSYSSVYRATINRIGKRKKRDKEGRDIASEGEHMGHYTYGKVLGSGYFGQVRKATHRLSGEQVAIKTLRKKQYAVARMRYPPREVDVLESLNHPHINRLLDKVVLDDRVNLVLELVDGRELCDIVERHTVPEDTCRELWRQLLLGVEYMHSIGVVHRDLKLENILIDTNGTLKIIDMGFGNFFKDGEMLNTFCGSPDYAAPELFKGRPYSAPEVDLWSLGVCLYAMLSGCLPFPDTPSLCAGRFTFHPSISDGARSIISLILKVNPRDRATIEELKEHPWTCEGYGAPPKQPKLEIEAIEPYLVTEIESLGLEPERVVQCLKKNQHNNMTTTYYLLKQRHERAEFKRKLAAHEAREEAGEGAVEEAPKKTVASSSSAAKIGEMEERTDSNPLTSASVHASHLASGTRKAEKRPSCHIL